MADAVQAALLGHQWAATNETQTACSCDRTWRSTPDYYDHLAQVVRVALPTAADPTPTPLTNAELEALRLAYTDDMRSDGYLATAASIVAAREAAAGAAALREAATDLRLAAATRMDTRGPHDARGAAVWDAAAWLTDRADALVPPTRREGDDR